MVRGNIKVFKDRFLLSDLLALRSYGWSVYSLSRLYQVDRKSIEEWCNRYQVHPIVVFTIERIALAGLPKPKKEIWKIIAGENVAIGKTYDEYLKAQGYPPRKKGEREYA